jgi:mRNA-degrading endonuclease RelE of RelBE toxin-antitoxin system
MRLSLEAEKELSRLPRDRQRLIAKTIDRMSTDPFQGDVKPLKGKDWDGRFRRAAGRYRIIFTPDYDARIINISHILVRNEKTYR